VAETGLDRKLLGSYLNDHLAGATTGVELARRARSSNEGNRFGEFLENLMVEIEQDRETLEHLMDRLDIGKDTLKVAVGWAGEKAGRLKMNGRIVGYSPLSRRIELEGLAVGVFGKLSLWQCLRAVADLDPVIAEFEFDTLIARAQAQLASLEQERVSAAELALTGTEEVAEASPPAGG
jgi:hypothetical protein